MSVARKSAPSASEKRMTAEETAGISMVQSLASTHLTDSAIIPVC
jgi:hypothetical protein